MLKSERFWKNKPCQNPIGDLPLHKGSSILVANCHSLTRCWLHSCPWSYIIRDAAKNTTHTSLITGNSRLQLHIANRILAIYSENKPYITYSENKPHIGQILSWTLLILKRAKSELSQHCIEISPGSVTTTYCLRLSQLKNSWMKTCRWNGVLHYWFCEVWRWLLYTHKKLNDE